MTRRTYKIGVVIVGGTGQQQVPRADPGIIGKVVSPKLYTGPRPDYAAMRDAANRAGNQRLAAKKRAEDAARQAAARRLVEGQVQPAFRPPPGRLWRVDAAAQLIIGPTGGIGITPVIVRTLEALATPGRHDEGVVAAAGGWRDVEHFREGMAGIAPKLAVIGLRLDRRKTGVRITKVKP